MRKRGWLDERALEYNGVNLIIMRYIHIPQEEIKCVVKYIRKSRQTGLTI